MNRSNGVSCKVGRLVAVVLVVERWCGWCSRWCCYGVFGFLRASVGQVLTIVVIVVIVVFLGRCPGCRWVSMVGGGVSVESSWLVVVVSQGASGAQWSVAVVERSSSATKSKSGS